MPSRVGVPAGPTSPEESYMQRLGLVSVLGDRALRARCFGWEKPSTDGPYKVLQRAKVGGEGGSDYIYADVAGRRLYIARGGARAVAATDSTPARAAVAGRVTVFDLETLAPLGEIANTGGQGVAVDPKSGHGFSSSRPVSMFDTKTMQLLKTIDAGKAQPDGGFYFDSV